MRIIKKILWFLVALIVLIVALLYIFDYDYILKGIRVVYFTGHKTAYIDDGKHFDNHTIKKGTVQPWALHKNYNKTVPTDNLEKIHKDLGTVAFLIVKNDSIWHEYYKEGYSAKSETNSFSMAKSITTAMLFKAIDDGFITSLNTKVADFFPEIKGAFAKQMTVGDLSTMSSGLNWNENYISPFSMTARAYYTKDIKAQILGLEVNKEPGKSFEYLSGATQLLGIVIAKATNKTLSEYLSESFWKPMGMSQDALWQVDSEESGMEKTYCCLASNARDFGRFGMLWQNDGMWNGKQLVSADLIKKSKQPRFDNYPFYGYGVWLSTYKGKKITYMRGILGQYVISIPEDNLLIVRLGHKRQNPKADRSPGDDFYTYVEETYKMLNLN